MGAVTTPEDVAAVPAGRGGADTVVRLQQMAEAIAIPAIALAASAIVFGLFILALGKSPLELYGLMYKGAFGTWFSFQNSLLRAAPLILTALCVAIPARLGLVVIGGEGAMVLGGLAAAAIALPLGGMPPLVVLTGMAIAGMLVGGAWIGAVGWLRYKREINETIASLLMSYIAIAVFNQIVETVLRDPASLNKPSTADIGAANMLGPIPGMDVHWGLVYGIVLCILLYILMSRTTFGFAAAITGGNMRAARLQGLPVGRLIITCCCIAGACAGLAGMVEVAAVHGRANASLNAGYGYAGILVAFLARHNPLAIVPVAIFLGGITASGGLIQRRMDLPDATVLVLQGIIFVAILFSETLYGRISLFQPKEAGR